MPVDDVNGLLFTIARWFAHASLFELPELQRLKTELEAMAYQHRGLDRQALLLLASAVDLYIKDEESSI
jgi:hypothetical protein